MCIYKYLAELSQIFISFYKYSFISVYKYYMCFYGSLKWAVYRISKSKLLTHACAPIKRHARQARESLRTLSIKPDMGKLPKHQAIIAKSSSRCP